MIEKNTKLSDEYAMQYEYLIRRAHQCGRHGVAGADADTYRRLLRNASMYFSEKEAIENKTERIWNMSEEEMLYDYLTACGEIKGYLFTAIENVKRCYEKTITDKQYNELENVEVLISKPNIENLNEALERLQVVMIEMKLFPQ